MLKLVDIIKDYKLDTQTVHALKGVSIEFRKSEFVSILGPSGCGKTTLLNIIGGLDRYTKGDLIISGRSTKEYKDKDWDKYRNHSIGFVFQSYNLIPHQTVLQNVELALTLSGVSKKERRERAVKVLKEVGLEDKLSSRPNQLSGGQMQRVAIARALVNDPDIILADEPTGALDTKTSIQIMEILKKISKNKLIIMVTHNPELANSYSNRIVKLLDGEVIDDSNPYTSKKTQVEKDTKGKKKRMSVFTALALSFKNLLTKKGRTILVSFAGSIGIIGIALILSISTGFNTYVNKMQEDALASYPITIESQEVDLTSVIASLLEERLNKEVKEHPDDGVYSNDSIGKIMDNVGGSISSNNLEAFKKYLEEHYDEIKDKINGIQYTYNVNSEFYKENATSPDEEIGANAAIYKMIPTYAIYYFQNKTHVDVVKHSDGRVTLTKTDNYDGTFVEQTPSVKSILNRGGTSGYNFDEEGTVTMRSDDVIRVSFAVVGVDTSSMSASSGMSMGFGTTSIFNEMIDNEKLIESQYDLLAGNFVSTRSDALSEDNEALLVLGKSNEMDDYLLYALGFVSDEQMDANLKSIAFNEETKYVLKADYNAIVGKKYKVLVDSDYYFDVDGSGNYQDIRQYYCARITTTGFNPNFNDDTCKEKKAEAFNNASNYLTIKGIVRLNEASDNGSLVKGIAYTNNFTKKLIKYENDKGCMEEIKLEIPSTINIYVNSFESKDTLKSFINTYNDQASEGDKITYTDYVGIIMGAVSTIINSITYVLIAFVSVSLVVSSIMIGIITYISVIERTKEIGVLRSVGASKRDVRIVFLAEAFIIGLASGTIGILFTLILNIPINLILERLTDLKGIASLPFAYAIILIAISITLTLISGFIPSRVAAKKDPVIALRTE